MSILKKEEIKDSSPCQSLLASIQAEVDRLPKTSQISRKKCCIYRVPQLLRKVNEEAYTPVLVSIGPFHHKNERLLPLDTHKLRYLQSFVYSSKMNGDLNSYLEMIKDKETQIRECYAEPIDHMSSDEFVRMVLFDSIFIIELFRTKTAVSLFTIGEVVHDLSLAENQLPFFILRDLYWAAFKPPGADDHHHITSFTDIACYFLDIDMSRVEVDPISNEAEACFHLLDLLRSHHLPSQQHLTHATSRMNDNQHAVDIIDDTTILCPTAMSLYEAGVQFRVKDGSLLDIHFDEEKGILTIPKLRVEDKTEPLLRNLIAFEQCHYFPHHNYIASYQNFMDCLINTWDDVQLLVSARIINNWLGNNKEVADLINSLGSQVTTDPIRYHYASITKRLNDHCNKRWNRYRATLKHTYFKHPWAVLSVIYAVVLLLLTITQVVTGILAV